MLVETIPLRARGTQISREERNTTAAVRGQLLISDMTKSAFGRSILVADLRHPVRMYQVNELLPRLFDVHLVAMSKEVFTLTGFERRQEGDRFVDYAQSWLCRPVTDAGDKGLE